MKKFKVVHIINNLEIGGAERALIILIKALKKYPDIECTVISLEGHGPLYKNILELGVNYKEFNFKLFRPFVRKFDFFYRPSLIRYLKSVNPDLIHGHLLIGEDFAKVAGALLHVPVIDTIHDAMMRPGLKQRWLNRYLSYAAAVSGDVKKHIEKVHKVPLPKITVIPNAIDFSDFEGGKKEYNPLSPVFLYVGRILKTKGLDWAINGLAELVTDHPNLKFLIYGQEVNKSDLDMLKKIVNDNNYGFVKFMGPTSNVKQALSTGDVFLLPSQSEGFGIAALEAAAAYKPLIVTEVGALKEMVSEGKSGYFVEYGSARDIAKTAQKILKGDVARMGKASHDYNKDRFSVEKSAEMYYNLYSKAVEEYGKI